jgi:hypothetical protein
MGAKDKNSPCSFSQDDAFSCKDEFWPWFFSFTQLVIMFEIHPQKSENWIYSNYKHATAKKTTAHSAHRMWESEIEMLKASAYQYGH